MSIRKIWGILNNVFINDKVKVDILNLEKDTACSVHYHTCKTNRFYLISGSVLIKSDLGNKTLIVGDAFDVSPKITHQFIAIKDSVLLEIAFVSYGTLKEEDITRKIQGGKFINGKFVDLTNLKKQNWEEYGRFK